MKDAVVTIAPILLFMMLPIWIPVITIVMGALADGVRRAAAPVVAFRPVLREQPELPALDA